jgi:hypothetical protein
MTDAELAAIIARKTNDVKWHKLPPCPSCHLSDEIYTYHLGATEATVTCRRCKVQTYGSSADVIWRQFGSSQSDATGEQRK